MDAPGYDVVGRLAPTTEAIYRAAVRTHLVPLLGHIPLARITAPAIQRTLTELTARGLAPATVHQSYRVLRTALGRAIRWGLLIRSPCGFVDPPPLPHVPRVTWDEEQIRMFLAEARRSSPYYRLYLTALLTGMREGELLGLEWGHVDLTLGVILVQQKFYRLGKRILISAPKNRRAHSVTIPPILVRELRQLREEQVERRRLDPSFKDHDLVFCRLDPSFKDHDLVFCQPNGRPLHGHNVTQRDFRRIIQRAGLPRIRFHDLRHAHATHLLHLGTPMNTVQERLGHSSPSITLKFYGHVLPGAQRKAADLLERHLLGRAET
jgi:integrase